MSHSFQNVGRTINLKLWDCENKVTATGEKILDKIKHLIENNEQEHVQFDYYMLTEGVAGEALTRSPKTRTPDTTIWLKSINEETLFNDAQLTCFDPELLFVGLLPRLETRDATTEAILNFLDQILKTLMQEQQNENKIWIRINIKFQKLLSELRLSKQEEILDELRKMYKEKTAGEIKSAFDSLSGQFLKRRVEIHTVKTKAVSPRFFSQSTVMPGTETLPFKEQVKTIELGEKEKNQQPQTIWNFWASEYRI